MWHGCIKIDTREYNQQLCSFNFLQTENHMPQRLANATKTPLLDQPFDLAEASFKFADFLGKELAQNSLGRYLTAFAIAVIGIGIIWSIKGFLARRAANWMSNNGAEGKVDHQLATQAASSMVPLLYLIPLYSAMTSLTFSGGVSRLISFLFLLFFTMRTIRFLSSLAGLVTDMYLRRHKESLNSASGKALMPIIRMLFWAVGITFFLDNLGFQISTIVAGLGIMGVAVGLAGQAILGDFFGYLVILMDRPFSIGDYITVGDTAGTVESIGLKTTRLRTDTGEVLVCPNGELTRQRIANFRLMKRRSRKFSFGVLYETPPAKVKAIPAMVREAASGLHGVEINRVHFVNFGASSLDFEVVFTVKSKDLMVALTAQESLNLNLMQRFADESIGFAYPTQTVYLTGSPSLAGTGQEEKLNEAASSTAHFKV